MFIIFYMIFAIIEKKIFKFRKSLIKKNKEIYHSTAAHESHFTGRKSENRIEINIDQGKLGSNVPNRLHVLTEQC